MAGNIFSCLLAFPAIVTVYAAST